MRSGILQDIPRVDHRWRNSRSFTHPIENLGLLHKAKIVQRRFVILPDIGSNHLRRIANQKAIRQAGEPVAPHLRQEMMGHLLLVKNRFCLGGRLRSVRPATTFRQSVSP